MERKPVGGLLKLFLYLPLFLLLFNCGSLVAQEKGPVFWTRGGNWGNWLKITAYPGLAVRTACGDDSTLKNYLVSSTDWQLRSGYTEPMAVVWRVQFFDDTIGKNKMGGWMLTHLKAGEVLDGWSVEAGHCQARNVISVQVKCAVRESDVAKCYDSDGNPYPPRPDDAFSGDHNPNGAGSRHAGNTAPSSQPPPDVHYYWCWDIISVPTSNGQAETTYYSRVFKMSESERESVARKFDSWIRAQYNLPPPQGASIDFSRFFDTQQEAESNRTSIVDGPRTAGGDQGLGPKVVYDFKKVDWPEN